jgi:hypothetical protein
MDFDQAFSESVGQPHDEWAGVQDSPVKRARRYQERERELVAKAARVKDRHVRMMLLATAAYYQRMAALVESRR